MSYLYCPELVWGNEDLNLTEKVLLGRIIALSNKFGYCNASNKFFQEDLNLSENTVSKYISKLTEEGFLHRKLVFKEGTKEVVERRLIFRFDLPISEHPLPPKSTTPPPQKVKRTIDNTLDIIYEESEDSSASRLARELGIENLEQPIKEEKKSQKISAEDRAINTAIIEEMKILCGVVALPQSSGQQRIFANFIRKRFQDALDPQYYYKDEVLRRLRETTDSMSKDKFLKSRMADLKFFYYKMVLHNSLFSKEAKKEVYL